MPSKSKKVLDIEITYTERPELVKQIHQALEEENHNEYLLKLGKKFPLRPSGALKTTLDLYLDLENYYNSKVNEETGLYDPVVSLDVIEGRAADLLKLGHTIEPQVINGISKIHKIVTTNKTVNYGTIKTKEGTVIELRGEFDFEVEDENGVLMIDDSKTSGKFAFNLLPKEEHFAQINLYMHSDYARERGINKAMIVYYCKDNSDKKIFEFDYNPSLAQAVLDRFQMIHDMWEAGERPEQTAFWGGDDWKANYSSYRTYLHKEYAMPPELRKKVTVSNEEFETIKQSVKMDKKKSINILAKKYGPVLVLNQGNSSFHLNLTQNGLSAIVKGNDGFSNI